MIDAPTDYELCRYRKSLMTPSGVAVCVVLAGADEPLTARQLAELAYVSQVCARDHGHRLARLGYATQSTLRRRGHRDTQAWRLTPDGYDFLGPKILATVRKAAR